MSRDWREVARAARKYKFDGFGRQAAPATESSTRDQPASKRSRVGSMNFNDSAANEEAKFNRRASWCASKAEQFDPTTKGTRAPPPPPPKIAKPAPSENTQETNRDKINQHENRGSENKDGTPKKVKLEQPAASTPFQERTNILEQQSTAKKTPGAMLKVKSFSLLVKEGSVSYYQMLEIPDDASDKDILKAFRSWARVIHPDHNKSITATEDFQALQHVYDTLREPKTRLAYNCREKLRRCAFDRRRWSQAAT